MVVGLANARAASTLSLPAVDGADIVGSVAMFT